MRWWSRAVIGFSGLPVVRPAPTTSVLATRTIQRGEPVAADVRDRRFLRERTGRRGSRHAPTDDGLAPPPRARRRGVLRRCPDRARGLGHVGSAAGAGPRSDGREATLLLRRVRRLRLRLRAAGSPCPSLGAGRALAREPLALSRLRVRPGALLDRRRRPEALARSAPDRVARRQADRSALLGSRLPAGRLGLREGVGRSAVSAARGIGEAANDQ